MEKFPFGETIRKVEQGDKKPKKVFVLGVYASAVHAIWYSSSGKKLVNAIGVASEPEIFWRGENAAEIISEIEIPCECGFLMPAPSKFNGASGRSLDDLFLYPLGVTRKEVWLCDLLPRSRMNRGQERAIMRVYANWAKKKVLPDVNWPKVPRNFVTREREQEIVNELKESRAKRVILLGDVPIKQFLRSFMPEAKDLRTLTRNGKEYGRTFKVDFDGLKTEVLPLVHPRQASRLGASSKEWSKRHRKWVIDSLTGGCS